MIIGIDGNEANVLEKVGISEYAFELLLNFEKFKAGDIDFRVYLKNTPRPELPKARKGWEYRIVGPKKLWTQLGLPVDLYRNAQRPDVFFSPTHYSPRFSPVPTVVSVMDLSYILYPELFKKSDLYQLKNWTAYSVKNAKRIFTISQSSKDDIIKTYQISPQKVVVTYPGIKKENSKTEMASTVTLKNKYGVSGDYILFVGTLQPRKNIVRLIEAFQLVSSKFDDITLVIIGKKGWMFEDILNTPAKKGLSDRVKFLSFVPDDDLASFYKRAIFFILPSLYEGFGLPVLEAMKQGCPVITSNVSSLPEAGGDAALYVDPTDTEDIAQKMKLLLQDKDLRKKLTEKGFDQIKKFSWEKTAKKTLEVLEEVARS